MVLKNYKELCKVLEIKPTTGGNAKKKQLQWFEEYFTYKKDGHKFVITEISNKEVEPMKDNRDGSQNIYEYAENIERLILDILVQDKNKGKIFLSKNKFFHALEMVNVNYLDCNQRVDKLSKYLDIDERSVQEWFDTTGGMLERSLQSALNSLRNQSLIFWSKEITICQVEEILGSEYLVQIKYKNKYGEDVIEYITQRKTRKIIREATDNEKRFILKTERIAMDILECENKQEVIRNGLWEEFENQVNSVLKDEYNIIYYYQSYKILSNPEHIQAKWMKVNYLLDTDIRQNEKITVNQLVINRLEDNAQSRQNNAMEKLEYKNIKYNQIDRIERRTSNNYIDDNKKLNETLIDRKAQDIRRKVRKVKLDDKPKVELKDKK